MRVMQGSKWILAFFIFCNTTDIRAEPWTTTDTLLETTFIGMTFFDWQQTRWCLSEKTCMEINPILGRYPSKTGCIEKVIDKRGVDY